jgi:hypothetical protein
MDHPSNSIGRKYHDESGSGHFKDDADVSALQRRIQALFARAKMQMLKPKRATRLESEGLLDGFR